MDPKTTFRAMIAAIDAHDYETAREMAGYLRTWLDRRGFAVDSFLADVSDTIDLLLGTGESDE